MKILAEDLQRLLYNAIQFSAKDSSLGGVVLFSGGTHGLTVYASDDYVAMQDRADVTSESSTVFHLGLKEVKELEKWLRDKEGEVELEVVTGTDGVDFLEVSSPEYFTLQTVSEPPDFSPVVEVVNSSPNPFTGEFSPAAEPFAIRAERFTKFRLLKTPESPSCKDGYPVDFLWDGRIVRWKCGHFLKGVIGPLARVGWDGVTGIKELYREEPEVLW